MSKNTNQKIAGNQGQKNIPAGSGPGREAFGLGPVGPCGATHISCPTIQVKEVLSFSYDTLYLNYSVEITKKFDYFTLLASVKKDLQSGNAQEFPFRFYESEIFSWNLQRSGSRFYPYIFRSGDMSWSLADRPAESGMPNLTISLGSITCQGDVKGILSKFKFFLAHLGLKIKKESISRFDITADLQADIRNQDLANWGKLMTRAGKIQDFWPVEKTNTNEEIPNQEELVRFSSHRVLSGIQLGKGDIVCRIYDKIMEMRDKRATAKMEFFCSKWNIPAIGSDVTRVEFQVRGEAIKQFLGENKSFTDLDKKIKNIWKYLTVNWLRHTEEEIDRENNNRTRAITSTFWGKVQSACDTLRQNKRPIQKRIKQHIYTDLVSLRKQAVGIYTTIAAAIGLDIDDYSCIIKSLRDIVRDDLAIFFKQDDHRKIYEVKGIRANNSVKLY